MPCAMHQRSLLALTEEIYDAATGGAPWSAVGAGMMRLVNARSASLMVGDFRGGGVDLLYHGDIPMDAVLAYRNHYRKVDLWTNRAAEAVARDGPGNRPKVWTSGHMVPDREFLSSEFYNDFGRRLGLRCVVGTVLPLGAAGVMPIGLHRPEGSAPFGEADGALIDALLPHLRRALQLRHQLDPGPASAPPGLSALDALSVGVAVVDGEAHVLVANAAAEALAAGGGLRFLRALDHGSRRLPVLTAIDHADNMALQALIRATAAGRSAGGAVRLRDDGSATVAAALVAPLPRRLSPKSAGCAGPGAGQALVLLRGLTARAAAPRAELLRDLFGVTPAEIGRAHVRTQVT